MVFGRLQNFILGRRKNASSPPPHFLRFRSSKIFISSAICIAIFSDLFLYGVIVPVVPFSISERAGVPENEVQHWVSILLAVYGAALLASSPIAGYYADHSSSRRLPLLGGLVVLTVATVMLLVAKSITVLVLGRLFQGFAAGIVWTVGQALLVDTVGQANIGQVMGYVSITMSLGIMVSPLLGGVVYDAAGYYAVYYMCFGVLALDIFLRLIMVEKKIAKQWGDVVDLEEWPAASGAAQNTSAEDVDQDTGDSKINRESPDIEATCSAASDDSKDDQALGPVPTARKHPKIPPIFSLFASRRFCAALWGAFIQSCLVTSFDSVLPLFVHDTFNWGSTGAGLIFLPVVLPGFIAPLTGHLADRFGPRWLTAGGFVANIPLFVCMRFVDHNTLNQKVLLCALLALIGFCLAILMPPLMAEVTYIVEAKEVRNPGCFGPNGAYAQAYGLFVTAFAAGCLVGPIWSGFIRDTAGWDTMVWTLALLCLAGAGPTFLLTGGWIGHNNAKSAEERARGVAKKEKKEDDLEAGQEMRPQRPKRLKGILKNGNGSAQRSDEEMQPVMADAAKSNAAV